jgi:GR25 family glycosyltransferase involved in LPS biosynthesis
MLLAHTAASCCCCCCCYCCRYDDAVVSLKAKVLETEGEDMREAIQDKVSGKHGEQNQRPAQSAEQNTTMAPSPSCTQLYACIASHCSLW